MPHRPTTYGHMNPCPGHMNIFFVSPSQGRRPHPLGAPRRCAWQRAACRSAPLRPPRLTEDPTTFARRYESTARAHPFWTTSDDMGVPRRLRTRFPPHCHHQAPQPPTPHPSWCCCTLRAPLMASRHRLAPLRKAASRCLPFLTCAPTAAVPREPSNSGPTIPHSASPAAPPDSDACCWEGRSHHSAVTRAGHVTDGCTPRTAAGPCPPHHFPACLRPVQFAAASRRPRTAHGPPRLLGAHPRASYINRDDGGDALVPATTPLWRTPPPRTLLQRPAPAFS